jgi:hypothetical protein
VDLDDFWQLVRTLGPRDDDFERLTDRLAALTADEIVGFEDRLAELLYALDTPAHAAAARARNDWFLYVRCAAVAAGRDTYAEVLTEPARLRRFARREAEFLLPVAANAYERSTGKLWEHESPVSYESGSNAAAWGEPEFAPHEPGPDPDPWLTVHTTIFRPEGWPAAYEYLVHHVEWALIADPGWASWWSAAGIARCHLSLTFLTEDNLTGTTVKVGRARVEAQAVRPDPPPKPVTVTRGGGRAASPRCYAVARRARFLIGSISSTRTVIRAPGPGPVAPGSRPSASSAMRTKTPNAATPVTSPTTTSPTVSSSKRNMRSPPSSAGSAQAGS